MEDPKKEQRRETIRKACAARGIAIARRNQCYLLSAPGVELLAADLGDLSPADLTPYQPRKHVEP